MRDKQRNSCNEESVRRKNQECVIFVGFGAEASEAKAKGMRNESMIDGDLSQE